MAVRLFVTGADVDAIYFTVDGSAPTTNSPIYFSPLQIEDETTVKAFCILTDGRVGTVSQAHYTVSARLPTPRFIPPSGANTTVDVTIYIPGHPDATIYYTLDGTTPSNSHGSTYSTPLHITSETVVKAIGYKTAYRKSLVGTAVYAPANYTFGRLPSVVFSPVSSTLPFPVTVTMVCPGHPDATIIYETDGTDPTYSDNVYTGTAISVSTGIVRAFAIQLYYEPSLISEVDYTQAIVATPAANPDGGPIALHDTIILSDATPGTLIYYTIDGSTPTPP